VEKTAVNQISAKSVTGYGKTGHTSPLLVTNQSGTDREALLLDGCLDAHGRHLVAERVLFDGLVSAGRDILPTKYTFRTLSLKVHSHCMKLGSALIKNIDERHHNVGRARFRVLLAAWRHNLSGGLWQWGES
jgi:hypothetical protein